MTEIAQLFDKPHVRDMSGTSDDIEVIDLPAHYPLDGNAECRNCHREFTPRRGTGGRPQVYCSAECRRDADAERKANAPIREQRAPQRAERPAPEPLRNEFALVAPERAGNGDAFDWIDNSADVVLPEQSAVAVYENARGEIVIRQEKSWCEDHDHIVVVRPENLMTLIDKLCDLAGVGNAGR
jgi:hypothetical protein